MLNEEKESFVMQIQILDEDSNCAQRSIFLIMDNERDWAHTYLKEIYGKYTKINITCRKVKYV